MLRDVVGALLVALDSPVPFVFPLSSLLFPLCAMVPTLLVGSVVVVPLSLPAVADCGVVYVHSVLGLLSPGLATCVSFLPGSSAFLFALGLSRVLRPLGRGGAPLKVKVQMP